MGELIGAIVEFSVGDLFIFKDDGNAVWVAFCLFFKKLMNALIFRVIFLSLVKVNEKLQPIAIAQYVYLTDSDFWIFDCAF
jgi:hypothetical protein